METEALTEMKKTGLKLGPPPSQNDRDQWFEAGQKTWGEYGGDETARKLIEIQTVFVNRSR